MADSRCPMCGNANPDHLDVCQFCQARLTPLIGGQSARPAGGDPAEVPAEVPAEESDGADDWLLALRAADAPDDYDDEPGSADSEVPDWLRGLGNEADEQGPDLGQEEETAEDDFAGVGEQTVSAEVPDWLRTFGKEGDAEDVALGEELDFDEQEPFAETLIEEPFDVDAASAIPDWLEHTRLTDSIFSGPEEAGEPETGAGESELLSRARLTDPADAPAEKPANEPVLEDEIPDWLSALDPVEEAASAGSALGWLSELDQVDPAEPAPEPVPGAQEEALPDWLSDLDLGDGDEAAFSAAAEHAVTEPPEIPEETQLPDWLAEFDTEEELTSAEIVVEEAPEAVSDLPGEEPDLLPEPEEAAPEWLSELEGAGEPVEEPAAVDEAPGWLREIEGETGVTPAETLPDWLTAADSEEPAEVASIETEAAHSEARLSGDTPEWLKEFEDGEAEEEALPDWLTETSVSVEEKKPAPLSPDEIAWDTGFLEEEDREPIIAEELADWPDETGAQEPAVVEEAADELPPWLDEFDSVDAQESGQDDELPGWLESALGTVGIDDDEETLVSAPPIEEELEPELEDWLAALSKEQAGAEKEAPASAMPEWLTEFDDTALSVPAAEPASAAVPDWLQGLQEQSSTEVEIEGEDWTSSDDAPLEEEPDAVDWLPDREAELTIDMLASGEGIEENLAPGELPGWLKAMRPDERAAAGVMEAAEHDTGAIERAGPLAGLRGVLSAEPTATQAGKVPAHFVRLQINDLQQLKADQLHTMVSAELAPPPLKRRPLLGEQRVLRYIIAAVLLFIAAFPLFLPGDLAPLPPKPAEMQRVDLLISGLNATSNVLVILDYQPGMSGEMDAAASSVFDHLMLQRPKLALVSTQTTGPALAERFIGVVEAQHGFVAGEQYVNLGYLPGDSTGLLLFAQDPTAAVKLGYDALPLWRLLDQDVNNPWQQPALQGVDGLEDFSLTLLLSDDPDTIRRWIEQVNRALRPGTLIVISSAQAEPLVRPYLDASGSQVAALVSGLPGGAAYEGFLLRPGPARAAWDAYSLGSLMAIILVLGTGTYNLYVVWKEREAEKRGRA